MDFYTTHEQQPTQRSLLQQLAELVGFSSMAGTADPRGPITPSDLMAVSGSADLGAPSLYGFLDPIYVTSTNRSDLLLPLLPSQQVQSRVDDLLNRIGSPYGSAAGGGVQAAQLQAGLFKFAIAAGAIVIAGMLIKGATK